MPFENCAEFEDTVLRVADFEHRLDALLYWRIRERFEAHLGGKGARFLMPVHVDLLQKVGD
ncbi:MAG: hypothetical protein WBQ78_03135 [Gammaproteobacteria bacterium]